MTRPLPANPEAERTVLGAVLIDNAAFLSASELLSADDFFSRPNALIYSAMRALADRGAPIDTVTLEDELLRSKADVPSSYFVELLFGLPRITNVEQWARLVRRESLKRQLATASRDLYTAAIDADMEPEDAADATLQTLLELAGKAAARGFLDNKQLAKAALREIELQAASPDGVLGLRTGLLDVDRALQGLRPGAVGVIAGRAKKGKSVALMQFAEHVAETATEQGSGFVAVFSLEMSGVSLTKRRLSQLARVNVNTLHEADEGQRSQRWESLNRAAVEIVSRRLKIMTSAYTVPQIHAACRRLKAEAGLSLVIVDYVQLLDSMRKHEKRYLALDEISRSLVRLALELEVPVVVAAQLNRESESKYDKRPSSSEIADGDSLIRNASWCLLIHRDLKAKKGGDQRALKNVANLILSDNRNGWNGTVRVRWNPALARFESLSKEDQDAAHAAEHGLAWPSVGA